jgi:hypothetical protein
MTKCKTVFDDDFQIALEDHEFEYQKGLTAELDNTTSIFDQGIINEIILWKINRYAKIDNDALKLINEIDIHSTILDIEKTRIILRTLIQKKGIQLPMASTILRFRNRNIYQIIDQRVYRIIYKGEKLKLKTHPSDKNLEAQIDLYLQYLKDLSDVCVKLDIPFNMADRILYMADKRINKELPIDNYSNRPLRVNDGELID